MDKNKIKISEEVISELNNKLSEFKNTLETVEYECQEMIMFLNGLNLNIQLLEIGQEMLNIQGEVSEFKETVMDLNSKSKHNLKELIVADEDIAKGIAKVGEIGE